MKGRIICTTLGTPARPRRTMGVGASPPRAIFGSDAPRRDASSGADVLRAVHGPRRDLRGVVVRRPERRADRGRRLARRGPRGALEPVNACAGGGGLYAGLNGVVAHPANAETVTWHFQVPASLKIAATAMWRAAGVLPNTDNASPVYWMARQSNQYVGAYVVGGENCPGWQGCRGLGDPNSRFAAANRIGEGPLDRRARPVPQRRLRRRDRPRVRRRELRRGLVPHVSGRDHAPGRQRSGLRLAAGGLAARRRPARRGARSLVRCHRCRRRAARGRDRGRRAARAPPPTSAAPRPYTAVVPCKLDALGDGHARHRRARRRRAHVRVLVTDVSGNAAAFGPVLDHHLERAHELRAGGRPEPHHPRQPPRRRSPTAAGCSCAGSSRARPRARRSRVLSQVSRGRRAAEAGRTPLITDAEGRFTYRVPAGPSRTLRFASRNAGEPLCACSKPVTREGPRSGLAASHAALDPRRPARALPRPPARRLPPGRRQARRAAGVRARPLAHLRNVRTNAPGRVQLSLPLLVPRLAARRSRSAPACAPDARYPFALGTSNRVRVRVR